MALLSSFVFMAVPDGRVFGLDAQMLQSIGIQLFNATLLAVLLFIILYKPVRNFLQKRAEKIKEQMDQAALDMAAADALRVQYKENLENVEQTRIQILESAQRSATQKSEQILQESKKKAEDIRVQAMCDIQNERAQAEDEMKRQILEVSSRMAGKIVQYAMDETTQDRLFKEAIAELEGTAWPQ